MSDAETDGLHDLIRRLADFIYDSGDAVNMPLPLDLLREANTVLKRPGRIGAAGMEEVRNFLDRERDARDVRTSADVEREEAERDEL